MDFIGYLNFQGIKVLGYFDAEVYISRIHVYILQVGKTFDASIGYLVREKGRLMCFLRYFARSPG